MNETIKFFDDPERQKEYERVMALPAEVRDGWIVANILAGQKHFDELLVALTAKPQ